MPNLTAESCSLCIDHEKLLWSVEGSPVATSLTTWKFRVEDNLIKRRHWGTYMLLFHMNR
jgi:hypothetical protein